MSREKARAFATKEGYGKDVAALTVKPGDKARALATGGVVAAKPQAVFEKGDLHPVDGLLRGHARTGG